MSANPPQLHTTYLRSESLGDDNTELFGFITAATYELLVLIRQFDQDKLWEIDGVCPCAHWLNWKCGIGMNAAREKVRVANALGSLPKISDAFSKGEIGYSKARAMTRVATPENEGFLVNIARHGTAYHVEAVVRGYRRAVRLNDVDSANRQFHARSLDYHFDDDGSLVIKGRLPAEIGAMLLKALDQAVDRADAEQGVSAETSKRLCCDTAISALVEDKNGAPLSIGRKSRADPGFRPRAADANGESCSPSKRKTRRSPDPFTNLRHILAGREDGSAS